jgi:2-keto-4-pentenoate hydratase/2-oxohepta-3-ene-1,7-dioic acid hydratase in catechol pathway
VQIGRAVVDGRVQHVVRADASQPWISAASLGVQRDDTADLIDAAGVLEDALRSRRGAPLAATVELACPIARPSKVIGIGLNYLAHAREAGRVEPPFPRVFAKFPNALNGPTAKIVIDPGATAELDYECELAVVIGRRARNVPERDALGVVFGYAVANDVSARDRQREDGQISRSKSFDTFCPIGPWVTTVDAVPDPQSRWIRTWVNGELRQDSTTAAMTVPVRGLIAFLSTTMTLEPGDVILTGTPEGVGMGMDPPCFLQDGDVVICEIEGLGRLENVVELVDG